MIKEKENYLKDLKIIKPRRYPDKRGFFAEVYSKIKYLELGIDVGFV